MPNKKLYYLVCLFYTYSYINLTHNIMATAKKPNPFAEKMAMAKEAKSGKGKEMPKDKMKMDKKKK